MLKYNYNLERHLLTILSSENCLSSLHFSFNSCSSCCH